jgi:hypothetical protein
MALDVFCGDICGIERIVAPGHAAWIRVQIGYGWWR